MALFDLPSGYSCFQMNTSSGNNTSLYGVRSDTRYRDTLQFHNLQWVVTSSTTSQTGYTCQNPLPSSWTYLIPDHLSGYLLLGCFIGVGLLVSGLFKVFQR